jgi:hypothetical protein
VILNTHSYFDTSMGGRVNGQQVDGQVKLELGRSWQLFDNLFLSIEVYQAMLGILALSLSFGREV